MKFSNFRSLRIVTGVRFVKINRIIHLQIKESELQKYGAVNASSTHWVPPNKFTTLDKGIRDGIDYHTLEFDQREVDLDDLTAPAGHVVVRIFLIEIFRIKFG